MPRRLPSIALPLQTAVDPASRKPGSREQKDCPMDTGVVDRPERNRFELDIDGELALAYYKLDGDRVVLTHTEVPQALSGQGIGSRLAKGVFDQIRASGRKVVPRCSFMAGWVSRHPEYDDIVVG
jgi:predicted GNAT family acetyltransferase